VFIPNSITGTPIRTPRVLIVPRLPRELYLPHSKPIYPSSWIEQKLPIVGVLPNLYTYHHQHVRLFVRRCFQSREGLRLICSGKAGCSPFSFQFGNQYIVLWYSLRIRGLCRLYLIFLWVWFTLGPQCLPSLYFVFWTFVGFFLVCRGKPPVGWWHPLGATWARCVLGGFIWGDGVAMTVVREQSFVRIPRLTTERWPWSKVSLSLAPSRGLNVCESDSRRPVGMQLRAKGKASTTIEAALCVTANTHKIAE